MVSDLVLLKELPEIVKKSVDAYVGCIAGAIMKEEYLAAIDAAGFRDVTVLSEDSYPVELAVDDAITRTIFSESSLISDCAGDLSASVASIKIGGVKPG
jgi:hypothetical protein